MRKPGQSAGLLLTLLLLLLLLLTACGGNSCEHLNCLPETSFWERLNLLLEDAEDGVIDEGESEAGDALRRFFHWLNEA